MKSPRAPPKLPPPLPQPSSEQRGEQVQAAVPCLLPILVQPELVYSLPSLEESPQQGGGRLRDVFQYFKRLGLIFVLKAPPWEIQTGRDGTAAPPPVCTQTHRVSGTCRALASLQRLHLQTTLG